MWVRTCVDVGIQTWVGGCVHVKSTQGTVLSSLLRCPKVPAACCARPPNSCTQATPSATPAAGPRRGSTPPSWTSCPRATAIIPATACERRMNPHLSQYHSVFVPWAGKSCRDDQGNLKKNCEICPDRVAKKMVRCCRYRKFKHYFVPCHAGAKRYFTG